MQVGSDRCSLPARSRHARRPGPGEGPVSSVYECAPLGADEQAAGLFPDMVRPSCRRPVSQLPPAAGPAASSPEHATSDTTAIRVTADAATLAPDVDGVGQPIRTAMAIGMEVSGTICTYEPVCGAWTTCPLPMYIATCEMGE